MKKSAVILIMLFAGATTAWGQNIDVYYSNSYLVEQKAELDSLYGKFERIDHYAGKTSIDDGFGGIWNVKTIIDEDFAPEYILWRPSNHFVQRDTHGFGINVSDNILDKLPSVPQSLPLLQGINVAFFGYIKGVSQMGGRVSLLLWIDPSRNWVQFSS